MIAIYPRSEISPMPHPFAQLAKGHGLFGARPPHLPDGKPDPRPVAPKRLRRWRAIAWFTLMALLPVNALLVLIVLATPPTAAPPSLPILAGINLLAALPVALRGTALLPHHPTKNLLTTLAAAAPLLSLIALLSLAIRLRPDAPAPADRTPDPSP